MMKAIHIDAERGSIELVRISEDREKRSEEMHRLIGCEIFTLAVVLENEDSLFVDDEGLLNSEKNHFFMIEGYPQPLCGNGLILGCDDEGNSVDVKTPLTEIMKQIKFIPKALINPKWLAHFRDEEIEEDT